MAHGTKNGRQLGRCIDDGRPSWRRTTGEPAQHAVYGMVRSEGCCLSAQHARRGETARTGLFAARRPRGIYPRWTDSARHGALDDACGHGSHLMDGFLCYFTKRTDTMPRCKVSECEFSRISDSFVLLNTGTPTRTIRSADRLSQTSCLLHPVLQHFSRKCQHSATNIIAMASIHFVSS